MHHNTLFEERLIPVEATLASKAQGDQPVHFLSGLECELYLTPLSQRQLLVANRPPSHNEASTGQRTAQGPLSANELADYTSSLRADARATIGALVPQSDAEAQKQASWLASIDQFTPDDYINFAFYREFSRPTLGDPAPLKSGSYHQVNVDSRERNWVEFRFGPDGLQAGYYDNPKITEFRLRPCSPPELVYRHQAVIQRFRELATLFGRAPSVCNSHINLSTYTPQAGERRPIIGTSETRRSQTLAAIGGLCAAVEDGAWMTPQNLHPAYFTPGTIHQLGITQFRTGIRVEDDYVELRKPGLKTTTAHGLLWMMCGIGYGLQHGIHALADQGYTVPHIADKWVPQPTVRYNKQQHLQLRRALERSTVGRSRLVLEPSQAAYRGAYFLSEVLRMPYTAFARKAGAAGILGRMFIDATNKDSQGRLWSDEATFRRSIESLSAEDRQTLTDHHLESSLELTGQRYADFLKQDALRLVKTDVIEACPLVKGNRATKWEERWDNSAIMRSAYGPDWPDYLRRLSAHAQNIPAQA